jgi:hypothetical protein
MRRLRAGVGTPELQFGRKNRRDPSLTMDVMNRGKLDFLSREKRIL